MKSLRLLLVLYLVLAACASLVQTARAQDDQPLALVMTAEGPIMPPMLEYIRRGVEVADRRGAEVLIIELNTPGGSLETMISIIQEIRASNVPVVVYVAPRNAMAGSAGAMITMAGHASAMAPETSIGASSPISSSGENLTSTAEEKAKEISKASIREFVAPRGEDALTLAEAMIDEAKAATATEALEAGLIDFVVDNVDDLLEALDGFTVQMKDGPRTLSTDSAQTASIRMSFIEQFLLFLTNPNIAFLLLAIGVQSVLIEISSPGGWVAGFIGVVLLTLAIYGMGVLPVNWFGLIFLLVAFVLFILDIKAPTHGALTAAGVASFIIGALVLFNSPGTPQFQRVSVPLVVGAGVVIGLFFLGILMFALRALRVPHSMGMEALVGKRGTARSSVNDSGGRVQLESELWTAEPVAGSEAIGKGDRVEVVEVKGLRLKVRKIK
ncbi:MAG TPA: nodulation protein NfeD [Anaerolineales bacterium]|nr:nodulation protein NfeD [Anaerolineales bacterium]